MRRWLRRVGLSSRSWGAWEYSEASSRGIMASCWSGSIGGDHAFEADFGPSRKFGSIWPQFWRFRFKSPPKRHLGANLPSGEPVSPLCEPISPLGEPVSQLGEPVSQLGDPLPHLREPVSQLGEPVSHMCWRVPQLWEAFPPMGESVPHLCRSLCRKGNPVPHLCRLIPHMGERVSIWGKEGYSHIPLAAFAEPWRGRPAPRSPAFWSDWKPVRGIAGTAKVL